MPKAQAAMEFLMQGNQKISCLKNSRRGQAAMEFLMTYGWAILAVTLSIAALAYFGILSPDKFFPGHCDMSGGISCPEYKISEANGIEISLQNNFGTGATISSVTVTCTSGCVGVENVPVNTVLENGGITGMTIFPVTVPSEGKIKADVVVVYKREEDQIDHTVSGEISGTPE